MIFSKALIEKNNFVLRYWHDLVYLVSATAFAVLIIQTNLAVYDAGSGDHTVILPAGLLRADSNLYLGDYFIRNAVMPHWFFEYLTTFAAILNVLSLFFFGFWILTIAIFTFGNLLLAKTFLQKNVRTIAFLMVGVQIMGARVVFGTSAPILEQALPHSMGGSLTFLLLAMWISGLRKPMFYLLPLIPIVHIQIGAIALGIVILLLIFEWYQKRSWEFSSIISVTTTGCAVAFGLLLRPIAGNVREFSAICERLIPHHCYAPSWSSGQIYFCIVFILIGLTTVLAVTNNRQQTTFLTCTVGVPVLILAVSLMMDHYGSGFLVDLVRGNNVYRIAVVVLPFLYWAPVIIVSGSTVNLQRKILAFVSLLLIIRLVTLKEHGSRFVDTPQLVNIVILLSVVLLIMSRFQFENALSRTLTNIVVITALIGAVNFYNVQPAQFPNTTFVADTQVQRFGVALRDAVPFGRQVAGDPTMNFVRIASGVGYAVDCKFRPIGGGEPLLEFYRRLEPLGGYESACLANGFNSVSATNLANYASVSDADFLLVTFDDPRIGELVSLGWKVIDSEKLATVGQSLLLLN